MYIDFGLLCIRVGIGLIFMMHGWGKIMGGHEKWMWLGSQMQHLGITFFPVVWGFIAATTEFLGGIALATGFYVRLVSLLLACVMCVALIMHIKQGDSFKEYAHALSLLVLFIGLLITGGGSYTLRG